MRDNLTRVEDIIAELESQRRAAGKGQAKRRGAYLKLRDELTRSGLIRVRSAHATRAKERIAEAEQRPTER